ncbi:FKBP-type peptidyl-prolyl cis-trans isomerase [Aureococcus anophagefferens]|nr:FKBP-type peptidyl-prolyl cis-trans isomerase [Aureococcus anophagefferens]
MRALLLLRYGFGGSPALDAACDVAYDGKLSGDWPDGPSFDGTRLKRRPSTFAASKVIGCWREAMPLMTVGSVWELACPPDLGYGPRPVRDRIPGGSVLVFELELLRCGGAASPAVGARASDDLRPVSGGGLDWLGVSATLYDSLDALYVCGLRDDYDRAVARVFAPSWRDPLGRGAPTPYRPVKVFEYHLRVVGGLLGAFEVSGDRRLLGAARHAAEAVAAAVFDGGVLCASLAGFGSFGLEFRAIARRRAPTSWSGRTASSAAYARWAADGGAASQKLVPKFYEARLHAATGLGPELSRVDEASGAAAAVDPRYGLRPEYVESLFVLYRVTGDDVYRRRGWAFFEALVARCRVPGGGFAGLNDVSAERGGRDDDMPSFFLAETLKPTSSARGRAATTGPASAPRTAARSSRSPWTCSSSSRGAPRSPSAGGGGGPA